MLELSKEYKQHRIHAKYIDLITVCRHDNYAELFQRDKMKIRDFTIKSINYIIHNRSYMNIVYLSFFGATEHDTQIITGR